eukprot:c17427_g1_i1.p1 GENE.c17427_g1_i1~~c17427_g1_i1.p1  ORF type:complete len:227 (-),score=76.79 c17427_g1_i1:40-720(-)
MDKVQWEAKSEYQYISNFKILQTAFDRNGVKRHVDVQKLVKGKYQDNLEFLQWIKAYFDIKKGTLDEGYDPIARRRVSGTSMTKTTTTSTPSSNNQTKPIQTSGVTAAAKSALAARIATKTAATSTVITNPPPTVQTHHTSGGSDSESKRIEELNARIAELEAQIRDDVVTNENLTTERDFYFKKLRDVEILCQQTPEPKPEFVLEICHILYAVEEGFEGPTEAQE